MRENLPERYVSRSELAKDGTFGVVGIGAGVALLALSGAAAGGTGALVIGGVIGVLGLGVTAFAKDDRKVGIVIAAAGALIAASALPVVGWIPRTLLILGGVGIGAAGGLSLARFIRGLRKRR